ncbi:hypothetical protein [Clostridium intestinale]|uniref:Uncharacterized protein n=1 Tax=Clostridium intestinale DSM 6191 TaxID=1121320 RepID=A0A1M5U2Y0_9CLOT|nr:hypothetical protein [Clostridium intestinale]SHH57220.1 hypothetical protein SAMN02745941_00389 [Clostridium intestinale DSM 6191]
MTVKELKSIIESLDGDTEVILKEGDNFYDTFHVLVEIDGVQYLTLTKEVGSNEEAIALETLEIFNEKNINYSLDPTTGEINYPSVEDKERGEKVIREVEIDYC